MKRPITFVSDDDDDDDDQVHEKSTAHIASTKGSQRHSVTEGIREGPAPTRFAVRHRERRASLGSIAGGTGFGK
jgi:hypothetical protein